MGDEMVQNYVDSFSSIGEIIYKDTLFVHCSETIKTTLDKMLSNSKYEAIIVKDLENKYDIENALGIVVINDISRLFVGKVDFNDSIEKYASEIISINMNESISTSKILMKRSSLNRLVVLQNNKMMGVLTPVELLKYHDFEENEIEIQLRIVLGNLHEAVCVINTSGIVTLWNPSSEKLYDVKSEDIIGQNISTFFPNNLLIKALNENTSFTNIKHRPKDGSEVIISAIPLTYKGRLIGAVSTDRDVNEITKLYVELEKEKTRVEMLKRQMLELTHDRYRFDKIVGKSKGLTDAIRLAQQVAKTDASVLITGESGTGKEVFSMAIHKESGRPGNFIPVNCSAIPGNLLESELFGYVEGAFTGASKKGKAGKFELADNGTLFLDEIGDMPLIMQAKLLRVLQDGIVSRIGSEKSKKVNARIIAATNKDLDEMMKTGEFREDLYYRLNVVSIVIPPLRERKEDIPDLINRFTMEFAEKNNLGQFQISTDAMRILTDYGWNGNVREVRNTIERLVILSKDNKIEAEDIPNEIIQATNTTSYTDLDINQDFDLKKAVEEFEKNVIIKALATTNGNKVQAAELLNMKRATLYYKLNLYNLDEYYVEE